MKAKLFSPHPRQRPGRNLAKGFNQVITAAVVFSFAPQVPANPAGLTVVQGTATATRSGSQLTVTASQNAYLNWQSFNISRGQTTIFQQPSASSVVWNQINGTAPS